MIRDPQPPKLGADYHIGAPAAVDARVSPMIQGSPLIQPTGELLWDRAYHNPLCTPQSSSTIAWRRGDLGGSKENAGTVEIHGPRVAGRRITTWGGSGGSTVFNDLDARMTVSGPAGGWPLGALRTP